MKIKYLLPILGISVLLTGTIMIGYESNYKKDLLKEEGQTVSEEKKSAYQVYSYISNEMKDKAEGSFIHAEFEHEYTPNYMLSISDAVVLASVISIDSADTKYDMAVGNTYGKMVINNSLYGDLQEGTVIDYMKSGGIMTLEEYEKNQIPEAREKREALRKQAGIDASQVYMNLHFLNDPNIEEGKVYLCYLAYLDDIGKYEIIGLGNGFREVNIPQANTVSAQSITTNEYQIKNNDTGNFESLTDYIDKYINVR